VALKTPSTRAGAFDFVVLEITINHSGSQPAAAFTASFHLSAINLTASIWSKVVNF
jgi:hypothetical protein